MKRAICFSSISIYRVVLSNMAAPTSFVKRMKAKVRQIPGTKPSLYNNQLLVSTGVPSLDVVLGGGIAVGTCLLVEEDAWAKYTQLLVKYFCAEGVVCNHAVSVLSADVDPQTIVQNLPALITDDGSKEKDAAKPATSDAGDNASANKMSIAWRYQNQPKVQSTVGSLFGHYYNLTKRMDEEKVQNADVQCVNFTDLTHSDCKPSEHHEAETSCPFHNALWKVRDRIRDKYETGVKREEQNILRIAIQGLGSPLWSSAGDATDTSLLQFLLALRATLRTAYAVCLITVPSEVLQDPVVLKRIEHLCDAVIRLESFASSAKKKNPAFRDYTGLFHLVKMPCLNELVPRMPETLDLAFRVRRKKFTIEKLHLPPEMSDTANREQDDPVPSLRPSAGCSGVSVGSSKLDF